MILNLSINNFASSFRKVRILYSSKKSIIKMQNKITSISVEDVRFPTSLTFDEVGMR